MSKKVSFHEKLMLESAVEEEDARAELDTSAQRKRVKETMARVQKVVLAEKMFGSVAKDAASSTAHLKAAPPAQSRSSNGARTADPQDHASADDIKQNTPHGGVTYLHNNMWPQSKPRPRTAPAKQRRGTEQELDVPAPELKEKLDLMDQARLISKLLQRDRVRIAKGARNSASKCSPVQLMPHAPKEKRAYVAPTHRQLNGHGPRFGVIPERPSWVDRI